MIAQKTMDLPVLEIKPKSGEGTHEAMMQYRSFTSALVLILAAVLSAFLIQHLGLHLIGPKTAGTWVSIFILLSWAGAAVYFRRELFWIFTSYQFAVSILATSSAATILGTFIVQHGSFEDYSRVYGPLAAGLIHNFFLYDLFHSFWFSSLLILTALSLFLVLCKRNPFRSTQWGFLLSHGGIILILVGAIAGYFTSETGMINLNEGQSASTVALTKNGSYTGVRRNLGFDLKLQDFQVEYYPAEYKIYAYRLDSEKKEYVAEGSYKIKQGKKYKIPGTGTTISIQSAETGDVAKAEILASGPNGMYQATLTDHAASPAYLNNGQIALLIDKRNRDAKDYRSVVSIFENGIERRHQTIEVNHPLKYKGFSFYQANFDPDNPAFSGIQMVKDPGLGFVYTGFIMMSLGVIFIFYIRPRMVEAGRKRQEAQYAA
jgi:hypothetical protein